MKTRLSSSARHAFADGMPDAASLATLRAWNEGLTAREAVARYLGHVKADRQSSRGMLGAIRRQLMRFATQRHRSDLAAVFDYQPRNGASVRALWH